jgi:hypothetical protein
MKNQIIICLTILMSMASIDAICQIAPTDSIPPDPARISVYTVQDMKFGAFTQGAIGGTITLSPEGIRTSTGDVVLLNMGYPFNQAIFEVEGIVGTVISIMNGPNATLTGSNGGSMSMEIGSSYPNSPYYNTVQPPGRTQIHIGATLNVGAPASNPPGTYSGTFFITFNQE